MNNSIYIARESQEKFRSREEAGRILGAEVKKISEKVDIVLGIPRGGVVIANEMAKVLACPFDVILSRKIGAPGNPEFAIGAVSENGTVFLEEKWKQQVGFDYIQAEKIKQEALLKKRSAIYRKLRPKVSLEGKNVIVTDDGVATGATMRVALGTIRIEKPAMVIAAFPVISKELLGTFEKYADKVITILAPSYLGAVSQFYFAFSQVEDEEVFEILMRQDARH